MNERDKEMLKAWDRRMRIAWVLLTLTLVMFIIMYTTKCSPNGGGDSPEPSDPNSPCAALGLNVGDIKREACPTGGGDKITVCSASGPQVTRECNVGGNDCKPWASVEAEFKEYCAGCHEGKLDNYEVAAQWGTKIGERMRLPKADPRHMPQSAVKQPDADELEGMLAWVDGGAKRTCDQGGGNTQGFIDLNYIEGSILADLTAADADDRVNYRYLVAAHKWDEGERDLAEITAAVNKTINSISLERQLFKAVPVDRAGVVFRIDIDELDINAAEWALIAQADKVKIVSNTSTGKLIRQLVGSDQGGVAVTPWFHHDNFVDIVTTANVYHALVDIPATFAQFQNLVGFDFADDLKNGDAVLSCFNGSRISSSQSNRMVGLWDGKDGTVAVSFDPLALAGNNQRNCFQNPLFGATGSQRNFLFAASESFHVLPNGLMASSLWAAGGDVVDVRNNQGQVIRRASLAPDARQNAAPLAIVRDTDSPLTSEILNSVSCFRCHSAGLIPYRDEVRTHVQQNAAEFNANDFERILELYSPQSEVNEKINEFNADYADVLKRLGVDPTKRDPMNAVRDVLRLDWNVERAAAFLFLSPDQLKQAINSSATARAQIGQLATGGLVTFDQFVTTLPALIRDARLFEDEID